MVDTTAETGCAVPRNGVPVALDRCTPCYCNSRKRGLISKENRRGGPRENTGGFRDGAGRRSRLSSWLPQGLVWTVLRTESGRGRFADIECRLAGFEVFNPSVYRPPVPARRDRSGVLRPARPERILPLFGRFFFVRLELEDPDWVRIKRLDGVDRILDGVGTPGRPAVIRDATIEAVRDLCEPNGCIYPADFRRAPIPVGAILRFVTGSLAETEGKCLWSDRSRVRLETRILGRLVPVTVSRHMIETVENG